VAALAADKRRIKGRNLKETSEEWCLRRWAMYFALDPESLPKSTWQAGQATEGLEEERRTGRGGRRRPRVASMGRERNEAWLDKGEECGGEIEGRVGAESSRWRSARAGNERTRDSGNCGGIEGRGGWRR